MTTLATMEMAAIAVGRAVMPITVVAVRTARSPRSARAAAIATATAARIALTASHVGAKGTVVPIPATVMITPTKAKPKKKVGRTAMNLRAQLAGMSATRLAIM